MWPLLKHSKTWYISCVVGQALQWFRTSLTHPCELNFITRVVFIIVDELFLHWLRQWASCQMREIAGCECAGNAGNGFSTTAVMHAWIANNCFFLSRWRRKCSRHSRRMRYPQFYVFCVRGPCFITGLVTLTYGQFDHKHINSLWQCFWF